MIKGYSLLFGFLLVSVVTLAQRDVDKITLNAIQDFEIEQAEASYYKEKKRGTLAINASIIEYRNKYASAYTVFNVTNGDYMLVLNTIAENDGESKYKVFVNGTELALVVNPETEATFNKTQLYLGDVFLTKNDTITISSKAVTNGKIPEKGGTAWSRGRWSSLILYPKGADLKEVLSGVKPYEEENGFLEVEAESYHYKSNNGSPRDWFICSKLEKPPFPEETLTNHSSSASGEAYIEALPDTRVTHNDELIKGENFFPKPGEGGLVSYKVKINTPGIYYVWVRAYSSGSEDNGLHVGVNNEWPESGARIQLCEGKHNWTWSSAQRVPENHCGTPQTILLNFETPGDYIVSFSMREDGFELDKWILVKDKSFIPKSD
ncbi:hypothetical protein [Cognatitamlana onchidii]|uniref:hypothetical protein n=1 Tax=Cognatitamlana onchidii TaxID=2562860 RepID=UPI00196B654D|nr:hypothetical protein [Algibacter onchidii]